MLMFHRQITESDAPLIAIVERDPTFRRLLVQLLEDEGFRTITWSRGPGAYAMVRHEVPDAVIIDIRLDHPEAGRVVLELLRADPRTWRIPVIVCSASTSFLRQRADELRQLDCRVLEKPVALDDLLQSVSDAIAPRVEAVAR
jgi:CheY-like chemotaxis protein